MKIKPYHLLMCLPLLVSACDKGDNLKPVTVERTVLAYIMGDNSLRSYVQSDINEMIEGAAHVDLTRNNLLIYKTDGSSVDSLFRLKKNKSGVVVKELIQSYASYRNSVGLTEMREIFSLAKEQFPATSYGLILWSHGDGWIPGTSSSRWIGQDGNNKLSISTLSDALNAFPRCEYILFDACFMQSVEVAYELRAHAGYFIGSPAEIPGPGAPYHKIVPALFAKNDAALSIAAGYYGYYHENYDGGKNNTTNNWTAGVAISVIDTDKLIEFAHVTEEILPSLIAYGEDVDATGVLDYDRRYASSYVGYYDFDVFIKKLTNEDASYAKWHAALEAAVPYAESTDKIYTGTGSGQMFSVDGYSGISTYIPRSGSMRNGSTLNESYRSFEWYADAGWKSVF